MWHTIIDVDLNDNYFIIDGCYASSFPKGCRIRVIGGKNNGNYFVLNAEGITSMTFISVSPAIPSSDYEGKLRKKKRHPEL